jgi:hypothetical protein
MNVLNSQSFFRTAAAITLLVLSACGEGVTERECFGGTTVRCRDFAIQQQAAKVAEGIERLTSRREVVISGMGQANYDRLLALAQERLAAIEDSRPNRFVRWFSGDSEWQYHGYDFSHETEFRRLLAAAESAARSGEGTSKPVSPDGTQKCLDAKIAIFRNEVGQEPLVTADMLQEWKAQCGGR